MAGFFKSLFNKVTNRAEIDWDDLEADLIGADLGIRLTIDIIDELRDLGREVSAEDVVETTRAHLAKRLPDDLPPPSPRADGKPFVILVVGVNGTGKTTSTAKLGLWLNNRGHSGHPRRRRHLPRRRRRATPALGRAPRHPGRQGQTRTPTPPRFASTPTRKPSPTDPSSSSATPPAASTPATT